MSLLKLRVLIILIISLTPAASFAQTDSITLNQLQDCIRHRFTRSLEADMTELEFSNKGEWLKYLPNLGVIYTVAGEPRPAVSTSTSVFYQANRDKKKREATRFATTKRSQLQLDIELAKLNRLWKRYQSADKRIEAYDEIATIDRNLFELYEKQYDAKEILPEEFLLKKKTFLIQEIKRQEESEELQDIWFQILDAAGCLNIRID
jgi:hypothetical protein